MLPRFELVWLLAYQRSATCSAVLLRAVLCSSCRWNSPNAASEIGFGEVVVLNNARNVWVFDADVRDCFSEPGGVLVYCVAVLVCHVSVGARHLGFCFGAPVWAFGFPAHRLLRLL